MEMELALAPTRSPGLSHITFAPNSRHLLVCVRARACACLRVCVFACACVRASHTRPSILSAPSRRPGERLGRRADAVRCGEERDFHAVRGGRGANSRLLFCGWDDGCERWRRPHGEALGPSRGQLR